MYDLDQANEDKAWQTTVEKEISTLENMDCFELKKSGLKTRSRLPICTITHDLQGQTMQIPESSMCCWWTCWW